MSVKLDDFEIRIIEEINNGRTEFLIKLNDDSSDNRETMIALQMLNLFNYITAEVYSDSELIGLKNIKLTGQGKKSIMSDEEIRIEVQNQFDDLFKNK